MSEARRFALWMSGAERRLLTLERLSARLGRLVRFFTDLEDVPPFSEIDLPLSSETTVWAVDYASYASPRWVPVNIDTSGFGTWATCRVSGDESGTSTTDWSRGSEPAITMVEWTGASGTLVGGIVVSEPGEYMVSLTAESEDAFTIEAFSDSTAGGWQWDGEDPAECRGNPVIAETAGAGEVGASGATQMMLAADHRVIVRVTTAGAVNWSLSMHLLAPGDVVDGACGG